MGHDVSIPNRRNAGHEEIAGRKKTDRSAAK